MGRYALTAVIFFISYSLFGQTFNGTGGTIPDDGPLTCFPITVSGVGTINDTSYGLESVWLSITHGYDADLDIYLKAPDGTTVPLSLENGGSDANFTNTHFLYTATIPISAGAAPFTGNYQPDGNLGDVNNGQNANGVWRLCIMDSYVGFQGKLLNWHLQFNNTPAPQHPPPTPQDCPAALAICQNVYNQSVSYAGTGNIKNEINGNTSCLGGGETADVWYTFTVQNAGNLKFTLTPNDPTEDYDWSVYNMTNATCADIFTKSSINVSCNFSGDPGPTGPTGGSRSNNQGETGTAFNAAIPVKVGETYIINVSNYSQSTHGYKIDFGASTATIFDNVAPYIKSVTPATACGGSTVGVNFSENINCGPITASDFSVTGPSGEVYTITGWSSSSCASGATYTNNLILTVSPAITANGSYKVCLNAPNSIGDICGNAASPSCLSFTVNTTVTSFTTIPTAICKNTTAPVLPKTSSNGITGTWNPATVSNTDTGTYVFTPTSGLCATPFTITIAVTPPNIKPTFTALPAICNGALPLPQLPSTSNNAIAGTWNPSVISNTSTATYVFTPNNGQCADTATLTQTVNTKIKPTFTTLPVMCNGALPLPKLPATSNNAIAGTWNPSVISNTATATYVFTPNTGQCADTATLTQTVNNSIVKPLFTALPAICNGALPLPQLSSTSNNAITGAWNPSVISNTATATYVFTPNTGQCADTATLTQTVNTKIKPTFATLPVMCNGALPLPKLPSTSNNAIAGTWNPSVVSNTATATYVFTPNAGQCADTATLTQKVNTKIKPTFTALPVICNGALPLPQLPATSNNAVAGTWSPSVVNNTATGTYVFTPNNGQCADTATLTQTVNTKIKPTFTALPDICNGALPLPQLPATSNNAIAGTWNPSVVSNTATATYVFTPNNGQCADTATLMQTVNTKIKPTFTALTAICNGTLPLPQLPSTSNNAIAGTWNPSVISNTSTATYIFTPNNGQCADTTTLTQMVNNSIVKPLFTVLPVICNGALPLPQLSSTSNNAIPGTWSPSVVSNTATATYVFTPNNRQCADTATLTQTVNTKIKPTFAALPTICNGALPLPQLPSTSNNAITGTWNPSIMSNTSTATYVFTPNNGQCADTATLTQTVNTKIKPTFTALPAICYGALPLPQLPSASNNGITGTWNPSIVSNTSTATYVFTPNNGQCADTVTLTQTVNTSLITPSFTLFDTICKGATAPSLPSTSANGIMGIWSPSVISNIANDIYTFTPDPNQCAKTTTINIAVIDPAVPIVDPQITYCQNAKAVALTANASQELHWYTTSVGGTASGTAPVPSTLNKGETHYFVSQKEGTCESPRAEIVVTINPKPTLGKDTAIKICSGSSTDISIFYNTSGLTSNWTLNGVPVINPIAVGKAGNYQLISASTANCADTAIVKLTLNPVVVANAGPDGSAESNIPYQLKGSGGKTYEWTPATLLNNSHLQNPIATLTNDILFTLKVEDEIGCSDTDTVRIRILKGPAYYMPTAFSPNADGLNDVFMPLSVGISKLEYFRIFNRYGELVFETKDLNKGWDGTYKGQKQDEGNYAWTLRAIDRTGQIKSLQGYVVLIR